MMLANSVLMAEAAPLAPATSVSQAVCAPVVSPAHSAETAATPDDQTLCRPAHRVEAPCVISDQADCAPERSDCHRLLSALTPAFQAAWISAHKVAAPLLIAAQVASAAVLICGQYS